MRPLKASDTVLALLVLVISVPLARTHSLGGAKANELYDSNDKLVILSNATFSQNVYNKTNVWLVEFYNSWCGFCQRFAPIWKEFASGVHAWRGVAKIAVVDCASFENNPLCRNLEVMSYPTLRCFSPHAKPDTLGVDLKTEKTVTAIRHGLLEFIEKDQQSGNGAPDWPNITPYRSSEFNNIWKNVGSHVEHTFLIFEDTNSFMGREVVLDYHKMRKAQIRRVTTNNEAFAKLVGVHNFPSLAVVRRDMSVTHLIPKAKTREGYSSAIHAFLIQNGGIDDMQAMRDIPREKDLFGSSGHNLISSPAKVRVPDVVYRVDLENTLRFSLKQEIAMHRIISGNSLIALQEYLRALASFFPTRPKGTMFLESLRDWAIAKEDVIKGDEFLEKVNSLEQEMDFIIPDSQDWIGCKGSQHKFRGYTCGLWTMFHALTVSAATQNRRRLTPGSENVLKSILQYVKYFFGCEGCSKHFQQMAEERRLEEVEDVLESVHWLWEAHNVVNKRLRGDITEDPDHPKVQFPTSLACQECRDEGGDWHRERVLRYVRQRYHRTNICQEEAASVARCRPPEQQAGEGSNPPAGIIQIPENAVKLTGWDFNVADVSLCVFLYVCSAVILILVYIKFVVKRRNKKKYNVS